MRMLKPLWVSVASRLGLGTEPAYSKLESQSPGHNVLRGRKSPIKLIKAVLASLAILFTIVIVCYSVSSIPMFAVLVTELILTSVFTLF